MEAKHTPGPHVASNQNNPDYIDIDAGCQRICSLSLEAARECDPPVPDSEVWANARLYAAAPDLYAVLREFVIQHEMGLQHIEGLYDLARTALDKATNH